MTKQRAVLIRGELAEQHANTLQGLYDLNKKGVPVGGRFLEQVQDVIRSCAVNPKLAALAAYG